MGKKVDEIIQDVPSQRHVEGRFSFIKNKILRVNIYEMSEKEDLYLATGTKKYEEFGNKTISLVVNRAAKNSIVSIGVATATAAGASIGGLIGGVIGGCIGTSLVALTIPEKHLEGVGNILYQALPGHIDKHRIVMTVEKLRELARKHA